MLFSRRFDYKSVRMHWMRIRFFLSYGWMCVCVRFFFLYNHNQQQQQHHRCISNFSCHLIRRLLRDSQSIPAATESNCEQIWGHSQFHGHVYQRKRNENENKSNKWMKTRNDCFKNWLRLIACTKGGSGAVGWGKNGCIFLKSSINY